MEERSQAVGDALVRSLIPDDATATLLFTHGYAESVDRHTETLRAIAAGGVAVYAYDLPGHGRAPGTRGFVRRFDDLVTTSIAVRAHIAHERPSSAHFLGGYSLGGLVAVRSAQRDPSALAGVVLVSPGLGVARDVPRLIRRIGVALGDVVPYVPVARLRNVAVSPNRTPTARDATISARTAAETMRASHAAFGAADGWTLPTLIVHGESDRVVPAAGPRRFAARSASADLTFRLIEGGHHDLLSGSDAVRIRAEIVAWIRARPR